MDNNYERLRVRAEILEAENVRLKKELAEADAEQLNWKMMWAEEHDRHVKPLEGQGGK